MTFFGRTRNVVVTGGNLTDNSGSTYNHYYSHVNLVYLWGLLPAIAPLTSPITTLPSESPPIRHVHDKVESFSPAQYGLQYIRTLVEPYAGGVLKRLYDKLCNLKSIFQLAYLAHRACQTTLLGSIGTSSHHLHNPSHQSSWLSTILRILPCAGRNNEEPPYVRAVRKQIDRDARGLVQTLAALKVCAWKHQVLASTSGVPLSMEELQAFFDEDTFPFLKGVDVECVVIRDPVANDFQIPIRFVESRRAMHYFIEHGCRGTEGSAFIESKRYQLHDSLTNQIIDDAVHPSVLQPNRRLDISIVVERPAMQPGLCPKCDLLYPCDDSEWAKCENCEMLFSVSLTSARLDTAPNSTGADSYITAGPREAPVPVSAYLGFRRLLFQVAWVQVESSIPQRISPALDISTSNRQAVLYMPSDSEDDDEERAGSPLLSSFQVYGIGGDYSSTHRRVPLTAILEEFETMGRFVIDTVSLHHLILV
ncbi:hypothetical protein CC1G_12058 [Coprinopsis cinerea okayama7|uniref:Ubiquitin-like domain-containing protein n=1 Tax=Coprinopsis cinerea (strain Okayama-7 / 130 / ATCC MYA-4618 / FGSC 9003) TaxID=240176 RepID=A8N0C7_COPC7|nr:hypothetical protein CC1G_12058 [Coprinopsis cinerea okayama7\|eukprot:XP_001828328.2 hypothetical protein CC1G_12058 [Coprinopsis cinerea okayama7\